MTYAKFGEVTIKPNFPNEILIQWELKDVDEVGDYPIYIEQSGSSEGPWEPINETPIVDRVTYVYDLTEYDEESAGRRKPNLLSQDRTWYFRIRTIAPVSGVIIYSEPDDFSRNFSDLNTKGKLAGIRRKITRDERILLTKFIGIPCNIFKKRHWGARCPVCAETQITAGLMEKCPECVGTGYTGGYWNLVEAYVHIEPDRDQVLIQPRGEVNINPTTSWMGLFPTLTYEDLIMERDSGKLWRVVDVQATQLQRVEVRQMLTLSEIEHSAIEYTLSTPFTRSPNRVVEDGVTQAELEEDLVGFPELEEFYEDRYPSKIPDDDDTDPTEFKGIIL